MVINMNKVIPGMVLEKPIYNENGVVILNTGKTLNEAIINSLIKNNIKSVDVKLTKEQEQLLKLDNDIYTTINAKLKNDSIQALRNLDIDKILENAKQIIKAILESKEFSYSLLEYKQENDIYNHSVRVAAFASVLAKYYNKKLFKIYDDFVTLKNMKINIEHLTTAALAHDLGMTFKDKKFEIKANTIPDTFKEKLPGIEQMPSNQFEENFSPLYTFCLLNKYKSISTETKLMILLINEDEKGNGPLKADINLINSKKNYIMASKIIRLCSTYDELLRKTIENNEPLENISAALEMYSVNGLLDKELTELFINHVPLYSVGVKIKLSDGRYGQVMKTFTESVNNYKPIIKVVPTGEIIDLRYETTLTIKEICSDEISFAELVARQIIDMNNEITESDEFTIAR